MWSNLTKDTGQVYGQCWETYIFVIIFVIKIHLLVF